MRSHKIKAVVFDWDGVIVDTMAILAQGTQEVAASYGVDISVEQIVATYFQPRQDFYKSIGIVPDDIEELHRRHNEAVGRYVGPAEIIFKDVVPTLKALKKSQIKLGIATNNDVSHIEQEIVRLDFADYFDMKYVRGGSRPKSGKLIEIIAELKIEPDELLYVGDLPSDVMAAKTVKALSAAISRLPKMPERLVKAEPDFLLSSLEGLSIILIK